MLPAPVLEATTRHSDAEWEHWKPRIEELWSRNNLTRQLVIQQLAEDGFAVNARQLGYHTTQWHMRKNKLRTVKEKAKSSSTTSASAALSKSCPTRRAPVSHTMSRPYRPTPLPLGGLQQPQPPSTDKRSLESIKSISTQTTTSPRAEAFPTPNTELSFSSPEPEEPPSGALKRRHSALQTVANFYPSPSSDQAQEDEEHDCVSNEPGGCPRCRREKSPQPSKHLKREDAETCETPGLQNSFESEYDLIFSAGQRDYQSDIPYDFTEARDVASFESNDYRIEQSVLRRLSVSGKSLKQPPLDLAQELLTLNLSGPLTDTEESTLDGDLTTNVSENGSVYSLDALPAEPRVSTQRRLQGCLAPGASREDKRGLRRTKGRPTIVARLGDPTNAFERQQMEVRRKLSERFNRLSSWFGSSIGPWSHVSPDRRDYGKT